MEKNNKEEEFIISLEDDVIDMTDMSRRYQPGAGMHGTYSQPGMYRGYEADSDRIDKYGVYQPDRMEQAKRISEKRADDFENFMTKLVYATMILEILYFAYFLISKNYEYSLYVSISNIMSFLIESVIIVDACVMYGRYKKKSLLLAGFLMPIVYPMVRNSARGESKTVSALWFLLIVILLSMFIKDGLGELMQSGPSSQEQTVAGNWDTNHYLNQQ